MSNVDHRLSRSMSETPFLWRIRSFISLAVATATLAVFPLSTSFCQEAATTKLTLNEAIDLALRQNKDLRLARLSVTESREQKDIARSAYYPKIRNESGILHVTELAGIQIPAGAFGNPASIGPIPGSSLFIGQGADTSYTSGTGLVQPLTQLLKIRESNRAAVADVRNSESQLTDAENGTALKVRQLYFSILIAQMKETAANAEVSASETRRLEATDAVAQGKALEVSALESHADLLDAWHMVLAEKLQIRDLTLELNDLLGLPLDTVLQLDAAATVPTIPLPNRLEGIRIAEEQNPQIQEAQQLVEKARAGVAAARYAYIPDVTGLARYSYQSGVPLLVHNFGTFGFTVTYDLFDGGRRTAELKQAQTKLSQAEVSLVKRKEEIRVQVEIAYNKLEEVKSMLVVAQEASSVRTELARVAEQQFNQNAALASSKDEAVAKAAQAQASLIEASLGVALAEADVERTIGHLPR